jgi:hypothetical protein
MNKKSNSHFDLALHRKQLLKSKRSQAQIIVTVLIILIVIAILGFVGTWVYDMVKESISSGGNKAECTQVRLEIKEAKYDTQGLEVERGAGGPEIVQVLIFVDGRRVGSMELVQLETESWGAPRVLPVGDKVQVAANISGTLCEFADEAIITDV